MIFDTLSGVTNVLHAASVIHGFPFSSWFGILQDAWRSHVVGFCVTTVFDNVGRK
jgi:hypothetical protein